MLVLSRRKGEKIVFPAIGVQLELLKIQGSTVRLGIEAPRHIKVLRDELSSTEADRHGADEAIAADGSARLSHDLRNKLNAAGLALQLVQRQLELGQAENAESTVQNLLFQFASLEREAGGGTRSGREHRPAAARTLVVEDDKNESALLAGFLRINGFDVAEAFDGVDALEYLATHEPPDLVLLDMMMPRYNGRDTIDAIRRTPRLNHLRVFAISGTSPAELGVELGPRGVDRWFQKPINPETLVREISLEMASVA
jgi:carbon storage regulator CsrA